MGGLLSSKVVVVEEEPAVRGVPSAPTSVAGAVGVTERGPIGQAVLVTSFEEYQETFGGFTPESDVALAAMGFFENGGSHLWVVRTVHFEDAANPGTATARRSSGQIMATMPAVPARVVGEEEQPFRLADGDRLLLSVGGGESKGVLFEGSPARIESAGLGPFALQEGETLTLCVDDEPEQQVTFSSHHFTDIDAATVEELVAAINDQISGGQAAVEDGSVVLTSQAEGTASRVHVTGGTASETLDFSNIPATGTGNVKDLRAVTLTELAPLLEAAVPEVVVSRSTDGDLTIATVATGGGTSLQVASGTAEAFGLDRALHTGSDSGRACALTIEGKYPGTYANRVSVKVRQATSGDADAFDFVVSEDGVHRETFPNLNLDSTGERHAVRVLNDPRAGSRLIRVRDHDVPERPAVVPQTVVLTGGTDGLKDLVDSDFIGSEAGKAGLHALDQVQELSLLLVPGRATAALHNAMVSYCEVHRGGTVFAILDPPAKLGAIGVVQYVEKIARLLNLSEFAAIYWPRVQVLNPASSVFGSADKITVPPSGIITGVYARTDSARPGGVYDPPAGIDKGRMFGVLGFESAEVLEEAKRDLVYPKRINPLTTGPGLPRFIDGSRTLKGSGNFPYVAERRGVMFIERSLKQGLQFARQKNHTEGLRAQVRRTINTFLLTQMNNGAFRSREPAKAFFVDVSETLNTPSVVFAGKLIARVGLATNKPAEFVVLRLSQDTRALQAELAAAGA